MPCARRQFIFEGAYERCEEIEEQRATAEHDVAHVILHQSAKDDRAHALSIGHAIDPPHGILRLVNTRHKWQSHRAKFQTLKLGQETVAHGLCSNARLVRQEKNRPATHGIVS
jgi:hypothetical protein